MTQAPSDREHDVDRGNYATGKAWGVAVQRLLVSTYCAMKPPSITSSVPVIKDASSEARNSTP
jgi:hypothetical protein